MRLKIKKKKAINRDNCWINWHLDPQMRGIMEEAEVDEELYKFLSAKAIESHRTHPELRENLTEAQFISFTKMWAKEFYQQHPEKVGRVVEIGLIELLENNPAFLN